MGKIRLDILLYNKGMAASREKAKAMIMAEEIRVNGVKISKPGTNVEEEADIQIESSRSKYVSRGGFKLEKAIQDFKIDFKDRTVLDIGASTGGYTDCALQNGARKIYALDVGYGQLDWGLRNDSRVVNIEKTNIRYFTLKDLGEPVDIITMDVSFISTTRIFPVIRDLIKEDGIIISLIKPQFEAGKDQVGKKGVVRDAGVHKDVLLNCIEAAKKQGLNCLNVTYSPIKGPKGNIEYFIYLKNVLSSLNKIEKFVFEIVEKAHHELGGKE